VRQTNLSDSALLSVAESQKKEEQKMRKDAKKRFGTKINFESYTSGNCMRILAIAFIVLLYPI